MFNFLSDRQTGPGNSALLTISMIALVLFEPERKAAGQDGLPLVVPLIGRQFR